MQTEEKFMSEAIKLAEEALQCGEVPVGCVFVYQNNVVASGRNTVNQTKNATRHAEINALDELFKWINETTLPEKILLPNIVLYVSVEPCVMCADVLWQCRLGKLVFGCANERFGGCGSVIDVLDIFTYQHQPKIIRNICSEKVILLLKEFYKGTNPNAPTNKLVKS